MLTGKCDGGGIWNLARSLAGRRRWVRREWEQNAQESGIYVGSGLAWGQSRLLVADPLRDGSGAIAPALSRA